LASAPAPFTFLRYLCDESLIKNKRKTKIVNTAGCPRQFLDLIKAVPYRQTKTKTKIFSFSFCQFVGPYRAQNPYEKKIFFVKGTT
jgi:hypothetical protein